MTTVFSNNCLVALVSISCLVSANQSNASQSHSDNQEHEHQEHEHQEHEHHHDHHDHSESKIERVQVSASRLGRIVTNSATRTEIINAEEIQEKALMRPGNISMLVAETGGVRVQTTSPSLGSANIRLQGLFGRYTQLLSDGLPLYGGQTASIGLLQIPPTDLANVEIIKGSASSLYGGSALGGVINLISRTPSEEAEGEVLMNITSRDGQDITAYGASPLSNNVSASVTAGIHHQADNDFDNDGWIDMAGYERATVRPRLYWQGDEGQNLYITTGFMQEDRQGGTRKTSLAPNGTPYPLEQESQRMDVGFVFDSPIKDTLTLNVRGSAMQQEHDHIYGAVFESDTHSSYLIESSLSGYTDRFAWLFGSAFQQEEFDSETFPEINYQFNSPGLFAQLDADVTEELAVSASARADWHSEYGYQFSPRVSLLYNPNPWFVRIAYGEGYYAPTPFIEDLDEVGLSRLLPNDNLKAEEATTASVDFSYVVGGLESSITLFSSEIENVTELEALSQDAIIDNKTVQIVNFDGETSIKGAELLLRYRYKHFKLTGSYLYLDTGRENADAFSSYQIPLTPRHSAGFVAMWEEHGSHLIGFEAYYTGTQALENNPYRDNSEPYWHLGLLGQITIGRFSWFLNAENLLNIRQTKEDPLLLLSQAQSGRWTTDIWSRNDGFIVNAGLRFAF